MVSAPSDSPTDLLVRAKAGDADSLGKLLEAYRSYLGLLARLQIDRRLQGQVAASDLVQETFLQAEQAFGGFRGLNESQLAAWLRKVLARNGQYLCYVGEKERLLRVALGVANPGRKSAVRKQTTSDR
jgi:RNA polymerase sigma-70 factor (ECF subfamily)